jgi:hypothetical protein
VALRSDEVEGVVLSDISVINGTYPGSLHRGPICICIEDVMATSGL